MDFYDQSVQFEPVNFTGKFMESGACIEIPSRARVLASCVLPFLLSLPFVVAAQVQDGSYVGNLTCGPLLADPSQRSWTEPIRLDVWGDAVTWTRSNEAISEVGQGRQVGDQLVIDAPGSFRPNAGRSGSWRTSGIVRLEGSAFVGRVDMTNLARTEVYRNCIVAVPVSTMVAIQQQSAVAPAATMPEVKSAANTAPAPTPAPTPAAGPAQAVPKTEATVSQAAMRSGAVQTNPTYPIGDNRTCWQEPNKIGCFTNMDKVFPMREVRNAAPVLVLNEKRQPVNYRYNNTDYKAADFLDRHRGLGLLIIKNGQIVEEQYRHGTGPATRFYSASMGKTVVGMLVGIAIDKGVIKAINDPAERYVPELAGTAYGRATIEQLLRMSSGVKMTTYDGKFQDDENRFFQTERGLRPQAVIDFLRDVPGGEFAPGSKFRYVSTDTVVLGYVLTRASGKTVSELFSEWIWQFIGADQSAMWRLMKDGVEYAGGDMFATVRDYGRLGILLANDGKVNGKAIIPTKWIELATDADAQPYQFKPGISGRANGFGYQTWIMPYRTRTIGLTGAYGQSIFVQPRSGIVMVVTSATTDAVDRSEVDERYAMWHGVLRSLNGYTN